MFNKTYVTTPSRTYTENTIIEKRAPTDESVRLLYDMENAAREKIKDSIRLENSIIDCVIHVVDDMTSFGKKYGAVFKINGLRLTAIYETHYDNKSKEDIAIGIRDAIAKEVANHISTIGLQNLK